MIDIPVWGEPLQEAVDQMKEALAYGGEYAALMADHHIGYSIPIGGVIAYDGQICPNGVGFDIACGNKAVRLDCDANEIKKNIYRTMNEIQSHVSFGMGGTNKEKFDHSVFDNPLWEEIPILSKIKDISRNQLGTVGAGNHYVDVFIDEQNRVWVGVHFGSRNLGHKICTHFIKSAGGKDGVHAEPVIFSDDSDLGDQYIKCMKLAGDYAYAGRDWVCERVSKILRGEILQEVHNHHNFAWKEKHFNKEYWVIRKGATPAFPGQKSFVGGSMGDISVILEGKDSKDSEKALYSTVHGAGRMIGRMQAKGKKNKSGEVVREPMVTSSEMNDWISNKEIELRGGDVDESPHCYKRIEKVLEAHSKTVDILHTLTPIGVCMASKETRRR